jgi:hypothetical protein
MALQEVPPGFTFHRLAGLLIADSPLPNGDRLAVGDNDCNGEYFLIRIPAAAFEAYTSGHGSMEEGWVLLDSSESECLALARSILAEVA